MSNIERRFTETLRQRNHELIEANRQLYLSMDRLVKQTDQLQRNAEERERYILYLETIVRELGWNPGPDGYCLNPETER